MRRTIVQWIKGFSLRFPRICPVVWSARGCAGRVSITFDDGPTELTPEVLKLLAEYDARATFFVLANRVSEQSDVLRQIVANGHEVGIHGYEHSMRDYFDQVRRCAKHFSEHGVRPRIVRTPGGVLEPLLTMRLWWLGYRTVLWSFDTRDSMRLEGKWSGPAPEYSRIEAGAIVLMHDDNPLCIEELTILLQKIRQNGLRSVTVSELLKT